MADAPRYRIKNAPPGKAPVGMLRTKEDLQRAVGDLTSSPLDASSELGTPDPQEFARAGLPLSEATRGAPTTPPPTPSAPPPAPAEDPKKFLGFFDSRSPDYARSNPGAAGVAMAVLEMTKALAEMAPKGTADDLIRSIDEQKARFWQSSGKGGFFDNPYAEVGRASANLLISTLAARGLQGAAPALATGLGKASVAFPGAQSAQVAQLAGNVARKLMHTYTGTVANAGVVGGGTAALQELGDNDSKLWQVAKGAITGAALQGGLGAVPAGLDMIKQLVGASGKRIRDMLVPFFGKAEVNAPNPNFQTPEFKASQQLEKATGTFLSMGQKSGNAELLNRERIAAPQGLTDWQNLARQQAAGTERTARAAVTPMVPGDVGKGLQRTAGQIERDLVAAKETNWQTIMKAAGGDMDARDMVLMPYAKELSRLAKEYKLELSGKDAELLSSAISRRVDQLIKLAAKNNGQMLGTGREVKNLLSEETKKAFTSGDRGQAADWHVASILRDSLEEVIRTNKKAGNPVAKGLELARQQWASDAGKVDAFRNSALGQTLGKSTSPEEALRMITQSKSPEEVRRAMLYLDNADPLMANAVRESYKLNLVNRGVTPPNAISGSSFSPTEFVKGQPRGRSAEQPDQLIYEAILRPQDRGGIGRAYDVAQKTRLLEPNPESSYSVELTRQGQVGQAIAGLASNNPVAAAPYVTRAGVLTRFPATIRRYLMTPEGQRELQRLTPWGQPGKYQSWPAATGGVAGAIQSPGAPELPSDYAGPYPELFKEETPANTQPRYRIKGQ